jgi:flavodoxin
MNSNDFTPIPRKPVSRRQLGASLLFLPLASAGLKMNTSKALAQGISRKVLVAFFTRTGNTRLIATQIASAVGAPLFQIVPAEAYPEDYKAQVAQAERERESGYKPPLLNQATNISQYGTVFLGFPVWGTTAPSIIRSFLSRHDLSGKTLVPFITHGGYGPGTSLDVIASHANGATLGQEFVKQCDQERETLEQVTQWLEEINVAQ